MRIDMTEDAAPSVEAVTEVIRKVGKDYWVTPRARIPFNPESNLRDDNGLSKVAYDVRLRAERRRRSADPRAGTLLALADRGRAGAAT